MDTFSINFPPNPEDFSSLPESSNESRGISLPNARD